MEGWETREYRVGFGRPAETEEEAAAALLGVIQVPAGRAAVRGCDGAGAVVRAQLG